MPSGSPGPFSHQLAGRLELWTIRVKHRFDRMFWRSIPRATEVFAPASDPPPAAGVAASSGQPPFPRPIAEGLGKSTTRAPDKSSPRLKHAVAAGLADTRIPEGPQHLPDVVHEATTVKLSKRKSFVGKGLKRTKSVVSLFRRDSKAPEPDPHREGETSSNGERHLPSESNRRGNGRSGLTNLGNSCYLASVLQALLATTPLRRFFLGQLCFIVYPECARSLRSPAEGDYLNEIRPESSGDLAKVHLLLFR